MTRTKKGPWPRTLRCQFLWLCILVRIFFVVGRISAIAMIASIINGVCKGNKRYASADDTAKCNNHAKPFTHQFKSISEKRNRRTEKKKQKIKDNP